MYYSHFGLEQSPFGITPNPAFFFGGGKRGAILDALVYAVTHGEGIVKVTGEVGSGKTMLCRMLESMLPEHVEVIYLVNPTLDRNDVLYVIAGELDLATGGKRPDEIIRLLQAYLIEKHIAGKRVVLLIEEAQAMPLDTLEEIRLFSNLETAHNKLLQIVLFGQPELDENLALPRMRQLKERITHSFKVPPLDAAAIPEYLMFRMRAAGYRGPDIFSSDAIALISRASQGIVRRISILADKALLAAFADNTHSISATHVKAAIDDSDFRLEGAGLAGRRKRLVFAAIGLTAAAVVAWISYGGMTIRDPAPAARTSPASTSSGKIAPMPTHEAAVAAPAASVASAGPTANPAAAVPEKSAAGQPADTPVSAAPVPAEGLLQQRLDATHAWLDSEAANHYTVQLSQMPLATPTHAERFLRNAADELGADDVRAFPTRVGNAPYVGITYGNFATRPEAVTAMTKLADEWGYRPQLRTVAGIKREIERVHGENLWKQ